MSSSMPRLHCTQQYTRDHGACTFAVQYCARFYLAGPGSRTGARLHIHGIHERHLRDRFQDADVAIALLLIVALLETGSS